MATHDQMLAGLPVDSVADEPGLRRQSDVPADPRVAVLTGGYDAQFVHPLAEDNSCPICTLALREPCVTDCGHPFCKDCVKPLLQGGKMACPVCRTELAAAQVYPNKLHERQILSLKIKCDEQSKGCEWTGELRHRTGHMSDCQFVSDLCSKGCGKAVMRKDMHSHSHHLCSNRLVSCAHCHNETEFCRLAAHHLKCGRYPISCVHGCGATVVRDDMLQHAGVQGVCPNSILACEFKEAGCSFEGTRNEVSNHCGNSVSGHLSKLSVSVNLLKDCKDKHEATIAELKRTAVQWEAENEELRRTTDEQEAAIEGLRRTTKEQEATIEGMKRKIIQQDAAINDLKKSVFQNSSKLAFVPTPRGISPRKSGRKFVN